MAEYTYVSGAVEQAVQGAVRDIPDFPKPGIIFKDITPILSQPKVFAEVTQAFAERYNGQQIDAIVGIESRGFIFGATLAQELDLPFQLIRKAGKLPYDTVSLSYDLEYGSATIEMHSDAIQQGQRAVVIDDLLATGGTAAAACRLVEQVGGEVAECAFVIELGFLPGREVLNDYNVCTLAKY